jgi:hypothetical protein
VSGSSHMAPTRASKAMAPSHIEAYCGGQFAEKQRPPSRFSVQNESIRHPVNF